jgi:NAD(P)-dependent dehydrogenase (short-subunit alcohol dehydrogenase family)
MRFQGRVVLVTGAAGGIGRAICARLVQEGAALALLDIGEAVHAFAAELAGQGARVAAAQADVSDSAQVREKVAALADTLGALDGLVNNAGLTGIIAPLLRMDDAMWARDLGVNLTGPFNTIRAVLPGMVQRRYGRIVNISSMAARAGLWRQAGYAASKAGLLGLTRNVALEHAADGISCNAVLPGLIETPAVARLPQPVMDQAMSLTPARRTGRTDEVAALVAFLLSDEAAYLNGAEIDIDGGSHLCPVVLGSVREAQARQSYRHPPGQPQQARAEGTVAASTVNREPMA